jgi:hypothetical protein
MVEPMMAPEPKPIVTRAADAHSLGLVRNFCHLDIPFFLSDGCGRPSPVHWQLAMGT